MCEPPSFSFTSASGFTALWSLLCFNTSHAQHFWLWQPAPQLRDTPMEKGILFKYIFLLWPFPKAEIPRLCSSSWLDPRLIPLDEGVVAFPWQSLSSKSFYSAACSSHQGALVSKSWPTWAVVKGKNNCSHCI